MQNLELTQYIQYIWMVPLVLFIVYVIRSPMFKGAYGEHRVNKALRGTLDSKLYHVLEDLTLPAGKGTTQIDHVVLSRFGIFVIETKNRRGWIFGNADQAKWTTVVYGRKFRIQNPLRQNYKHVKVVQELLSLRDNQIYNVIAFVGSGTPKTAMPPNVAWNMRSLLRFIESKQDVVLGSPGTTPVGCQPGARYPNTSGAR